MPSYETFRCRRCQSNRSVLGENARCVGCGSCRVCHADIRQREGSSHEYVRHIARAWALSSIPGSESVPIEPAAPAQIQSYAAVGMKQRTNFDTGEPEPVPHLSGPKEVKTNHSKRLVGVEIEVSRYRDGPAVTALMRTLGGGLVSDGSV